MKLNLPITKLLNFFKAKKKINLLAGGLLFLCAVISLAPGMINLIDGLYSLNWIIFNVNNYVSVIIFSLLMLLPSLILFCTAYLMWEEQSSGWKLAIATCGVTILLAATNSAMLYFALPIAVLSGLAVVFQLRNRKLADGTKDSPIVTENVMKLGLRLSVFLCIGTVVALVGYLVVVASPFLSVQLFTKMNLNYYNIQAICWGIPIKAGDTGGVLSYAVGTLLVVFFCEFIAVPIGIGAAIYLSEYSSQNRLVGTIRFFIETLAGSPSIVIAIVGFTIFSITLKWGFCLWAAAIALSFMALPWNIRVSEGALKSVPKSYREASYALGATQWQTTRLITLYSAIPGIITGILLGIGVAIGETLVLLFNYTGTATISLPTPFWKVFDLHTYLPSLTVFIDQTPSSPITGHLSNPTAAQQAFFEAHQNFLSFSLAAAAAVVLITIYLAFCIVALLLRNYLNRRMMGS
jgi:phosphate transport system permease protein